MEAYARTLNGPGAVNPLRGTQLRIVIAHDRDGHPDRHISLAVAYDGEWDIVVPGHYSGHLRPAPRLGELAQLGLAYVGQHRAA